MLTIHLNKLQFFAYHGLYETEKKLGNNFIVDVSVDADVPQAITKLEQTLDYVSIYKLIEKRMIKPTPLLETVAQDIVKQLHQSDKRVKSVSITITKVSPPIENFNGVVAITYKKDF